MTTIRGWLCRSSTRQFYRRRSTSPLYGAFFFFWHQPKSRWCWIAGRVADGLSRIPISTMMTMTPLLGEVLTTSASPFGHCCATPIALRSNCHKPLQSALLGFDSIDNIQLPEAARADLSQFSDGRPTVLVRRPPLCLYILLTNSQGT